MFSSIIRIVVFFLIGLPLLDRSVSVTPGDNAKQEVIEAYERLKTKTCGES